VRATASWSPTIIFHYRGSQDRVCSQLQLRSERDLRICTQLQTYSSADPSVCSQLQIRRPPAETGDPKAKHGVGWTVRPCQNGVWPSLSDLTAAAVLQALGEFDTLGRDAFLQKYGFGRSRGYFLQHAGKPYDSKAIAGAAHGHIGSTFAPLSASKFSGGDKTVAKRLRDLGFTVLAPSASYSRTTAARTSFPVSDQFGFMGAEPL
jgi:hypothetical protein